MKIEEKSIAEGTERIENDFVKIWIEDGIMYARYKPGVVIDLAAARKCVADRILLTKGKYYPTLGYVADITNISKEARDFFSHDEGVGNMKKLGLVTSSPVSKMLGNFYMLVSKPTIPTRLFTTEEEAIIWLKSDQ